jgi:hypothetical protein
MIPFWEATHFLRHFLAFLTTPAEDGRSNLLFENTNNLSLLAWVKVLEKEKG